MSGYSLDGEDEFESGRPTSAPPSLELNMSGLFDIDGDTLVPPACVRSRVRGAPPENA